jgi:large conductance mechanosensitive channel
VSGFKNFLLRGNLIELAVGFIMATAFGKVVEAFVAWLTGLLPASANSVFDDTTRGGHLVNTIISFVILAAVVYFLIVVPYTKAKERFFPEEASGPTEVELLTQIRDSLATRA